MLESKCSCFGNSMIHLTRPRITVRDCGPLFDILAGDDGLITISEFCRGIMQLKGTARSLDIVVLQHENSKLMSECSLALKKQSCRTGTRKSRLRRLGDDYIWCLFVFVAFVYF